MIKLYDRDARDLSRLLDPLARYLREQKLQNNPKADEAFDQLRAWRPVGLADRGDEASTRADAADRLQLIQSEIDDQLRKISPTGEPGPNVH